MKLSVNKKMLGEAPEMWLRRAGYSFIANRAGGQDSFARRLGRDFYPRFHVYFTESRQGDETLINFNIHLDQKKPGYEGFNRHNAEYDGEIIEAETDRLKSLMLPDFFI